jgi:hypothetical protein
MKKVQVFIVLTALVTITSNAQIIKTKLDLVGGIGAREYFHGGIRYQYTDITQLGLYFGSDLELREEQITTICFDHMIHFGQLSFISNRPAWYSRQGVTFSKNIEGVNRTRKFTYLNLSFGREFNVNTWLGFNADLGFIWQVFSVTEENQGVRKDNLRYILPLARIQTFISF